MGVFKGFKGFSTSCPKRIAFHKDDGVTVLDKKGVPIHEDANCSKVIGTFARKTCGVVIEDQNDKNIMKIKYNEITGYVKAADAHSMGGVCHLMEFQWRRTADAAHHIRKVRVPVGQNLDNVANLKIGEVYQSIVSMKDDEGKHDFPRLSCFVIEAVGEKKGQHMHHGEHDDHHPHHHVHHHQLKMAQLDQLQIKVKCVGHGGDEKDGQFTKSKISESVWIKPLKLGEFVLMNVNPHLLKAVRPFFTTESLDKNCYYTIQDGHTKLMCEGFEKEVRAIDVGETIRLKEIADTHLVVELIAQGFDGELFAIEKPGKSSTFRLEKCSRLPYVKKSSPEEHVDELNDLIKKGNNCKVLSILKEHPNLMNQCGEEGHYPLIIATKFGRLDLMKAFFQKYKARHNVQNSLGETAMHVAVQFNVVDKRLDERHLKLRTQLKLDMLQLLVKNGADINAQDHKGATPIMNCMKYLPLGAVEVAEFLFDNNCDCDKKTHSKKTMWTMLKKHRQAEQEEELNKLFEKEKEKDADKQLIVDEIMAERVEAAEAGERVELDLAIESDDEEDLAPPKVTVAIELRELIRDRKIRDKSAEVEDAGGFSLKLRKLERQHEDDEEKAKKDEIAAMHIKNYKATSPDERWTEFKTLNQFTMRVPRLVAVLQQDAAALLKYQMAIPGAAGGLQDASDSEDDKAKNEGAPKDARPSLPAGEARE